MSHGSQGCSRAGQSQPRRPAKIIVVDQFFLKFCSYFPYNAKLCINGHEYLKRQLTKRGIAFEPLDNGIRSCADPEAMQRLADGLTAD